MCLTLSLAKLNERTPYRLESSGLYSFSFITEQGKKYDIGFIKDLMIADDGIYQFFITTEDNFKTLPDKKIEETITIIIEEFFTNKDVALDYICSTEDNKQSVRHRKFRQWFNHCLKKEDFLCEDIIVTIDNITYYSSLIIPKTNSNIDQIINAKENFQALMNDK